MTRKFKMAGVLMAVVAMFALTASSASATFTSAGYPATATGTSSGDVFTSFGATVKCTNNSFTGSLAAASTTLTITPTYSSCTAFGLPATVNFTGCDYLFHNAAGSTAVTTDLVCPAGKTPDITVYSSSAHSTALCHVTVTPFTGKSGLTVDNTATDADLTGTVTGITAHQSRTSAILCPPGTTDATASYAIQPGGITVTGNNGAVSVS